MTSLIRRVAALSFLLAPLFALAGERILVLRTQEDSRYPASAEICANAPFQPVNVHLGASVWTLETSGSTGQVVHDDARFAGTATGCGLLTTAAPFVPQPFLISFNLRDGRYTAVGTCTITSNQVPVPGLLLVTCAMKIVSAPAGVLGGSATSASVFNPYGLTGFDTGSIWTLRIHDAR
jgi:hypothetical protein